MLSSSVTELTRMTDDPEGNVSVVKRYIKEIVLTSQKQRWTRNLFTDSENNHRNSVRG